MTGRQKMSLRRNLRLGAVIAAGMYLAVGASALGNQSVPETRNEASPATTDTVEMIRVQPETEAPKATDSVAEETEEPGYSSIIMSRDWDAEDAYLLCRIAMAEAGNQDTEGKALVMLVVLNRVWGDNEFPGTVKEVIYQPGQFSPVLNGTFEDAKPDRDCWEALEMVEMGWDESRGALYFESRSESTWHQAHLKFLFRHGDHFFYTERE